MVRGKSQELQGIVINRFKSLPVAKFGVASLLTFPRRIRVIQP